MTIADWVTTVVAVIGSVTGIIALVKTFRVDRRVRLEPYFKNTWLEVQPSINSHMQTISDWLKTLQSMSARKLLSSAPSTRTLVQVDSYNWSYDKRFYKLLRSYETGIQQLKSVVAEYNELLYPTTRDCAEWIIFTRPLQEGSIADAVGKKLRQAEELEEVRNQNNEKAGSILKIARKYIRPEKETSFEVLWQNKDYQRDLGTFRARVQKSVKKTDRIIGQIRERADYYNRLFGVRSQEDI